jgi:hypothetical protein
VLRGRAQKRVAQPEENGEERESRDDDGPERASLDRLLHEERGDRVPAKRQSRALDERLLHVLLGDVVRATGEESKAVRCARPGVQPKVSAVKPPLSAS